MPLVAVLTRVSEAEQAVRQSLEGVQTVAVARSWDRLLWLVRERPVTVAVLDSEALGGDLPEDVAVGDLRRRFPSLATVFIARPHTDPISLFRLGRAGIGGLVLLAADSLSAGVADAMREALRNGTEAIVARAVSARVPPRESAAVRMALEGVQQGWGSEELAEQLGLTRPHASVRLRACGLPSTGHMLLWAKLLHAGRWLADPGRTGESVSRQLEYSSGAAFRRALRTYVGLTPSQVKSLGGLKPILDRFLDACGLGDSLEGALSLA
jgi:AraC-like DNA-binding protein